MTTDLYVSPTGSDSNVGTQAAPFRTILAASEAAQPGTTVHVAPGTYAGGFTTSASGTATAHITYVSDVPWGAKITGDSSGLFAGWYNQGSYVDIKGFNIDGTNSPAALRIGFYNDGSHISFTGNEVHDILRDPTAYAAAAATGNGGAGVDIDNYNGAVDASVIGNVVFNIGPDGAYAPPGAHGIYEVTNGTVANNVIYNIDGLGVSTWHGAKNINIINNTVDGARDGGILVGSGDSGVGAGTGNGFTVANNIVTNSAFGIEEQGQTGSNNWYDNNLFSGNSGPNYSIVTGHAPTGTVTANPMFVNSGSHDYHLAAGSPAVNAGTATDAPASDIAGTARPQGGGYDIGAYEFVSSTPTPTPTPAPTPSPTPAPPPVSSTDLYVSATGSDSNPGTQAAPFQTILAASQVAQPGTTVHVAPGIYDGGFTTAASGTASNPIHYVSDTKWGAIIVPSANSPNSMAWNNSGDYVAIDGFQLDGSSNQSGTPWRFGIYSSGSGSIIENNNVHDIATDAAALSDPNGAAGIMGDSYNGATNIGLIGNVVHAIGPSSGSGGNIQAIDESTSGSVMNNLVFGTNGSGITLWHDANHVAVTNNTVVNNTNGVMIGGGEFYNTTGPDDFDFVANNIIYHNGNNGIAENGTTGTHNVYANNLVSSNGTNWSLQNGNTHSNDVTANPNFVNYTGTSSGDYHLAAGSPGIDTGTATNAPTTDLAGVARPQGAGYDIGAYEFVASTPSPTPSSPQPFTLPTSGAWTDSILGTQHADTLTGTAGNDYINGKAGADTMIGGAGDDTYLVNTSGDTVIENAGGGIDTVLSKAGSYTLPANVENLTLLGTSAQSGVGNGLNNLITAGSGNDVINGGAGNDIIKAGIGADVLTGGPGNDMFVFSAVGAKSTVADFHVGEDLIDLRPLLKGYTGSDPVADHTLALVSDGSDGTTIMVDPTHSGTQHALVTLQHVAPNAVHVGADVLWH